MDWNLILNSALGQLLAIAIVVCAWTVIQLWRFLSSFAVAAHRTRVRIVCESKE